MAKEEIIGLSGLKGLKGLSDKDLRKWEKENKDKIAGKSLEYKDRRYRNQQFVKAFGEDLFHSMNAEERDTYHAQYVIDNELTKYKDDASYNTLKSLDLEDQVSFLEKGYATDKEIQDRTATLNEGLEIDNLDSSKKFSITDYLASDDFYQASAKTAARAMNFLSAGYDLSKKSETLKTLSDKTSIRRETAIRPSITAIYSDYQNALNNGQLTESDIDKQFEDTFGKLSTYYRGFKDTSEFNDLTTTHKMQFLSKFFGVLQEYGEEEAYRSMERNMQEWVAEHQNWGESAFNSNKAIFTKMTAQTANTGLYFKTLGMGEEELALFMQGKDKNGNDLPWYENPLYWQGLEQFNTWDANYINKVRANGGVSKFSNVWKPGEEMKFLSEGSFFQAYEQVGYIASDIAMSYATGALAKGIGWGIEAAFKSMPRTLNVLNKVGNVVGTTADVLRSGAGTAQAEGLNAFQETLQSAREQIDAQVEEEARMLLENYAQTPEYKEDIDEQKKYLQRTARERNVVYTDEQLTREATDLVNRTLMDKYTANRKESHELSGDYREAGRAAALAYRTTSTIDLAREAASNAMFQKFLFNKGTRKALGDEGPTPQTTRNADGTVNASISFMEKWVIPVIKNPIVEALEEAGDNIVANYGQNVGLNQFNSYFNKAYDPEAYSNMIEGPIGNMIAGFQGVGASFADKQLYYEAWLGALGGGGNIMPNIGSDKGQSFGTDAEGNPITFMESISKYVFNPILNDLAEASKKERLVQSEVKTVNKIIREKGEDIEALIRGVSALTNWDKAVKEGSTLKTLDEEARTAFEVVQDLISLRDSEIGSQSELYQNTMGTLRGLSDGTISDTKLNDLVTSFLGQSENRTIAGKPDAKEQAVTLLQKNANALLDIFNTVDEVTNTIESSPKKNLVTPETIKELAFMKVMGKNWQERLTSIEKELGVKSTTSSPSAIGSKKAFDREVKAQEEVIGGLQKEYDSISEEISESEALVKKLKGDEKAHTKFTIGNLKVQQKALKDKIKKQRVALEKLKLRGDQFENSSYSETLTKEQILSLNAEQRAQMLDPTNREDYSEEQQVIINETLAELEAKDLDAVNKLRDAKTLSQRLGDLNTAFSTIASNPLETAQYLSEANKVRVQKTLSVVGQKLKQATFDSLDSKTGEDLFNDAKDLSVPMLDEYIEAHPERAEELAPAREVAKWREDAAATINGMDIDPEAKKALRQSVINITKNAKSLDEAINAVENALDSDAVSDSDKQLLNSFLNEMQKLEYQRDATRIQKREEKRAREEQLKREVEERQAEEEAINNIEEAPTEEEPNPTEATLDEESVQDVDLSEEPVEESNIDEGSTEYLVTPSIEEEIDTLPSDVEVNSTPISNIDEVETANEEPKDTGSTIMLGNRYYGYDLTELKGPNKAAVLRKPAHEGDTLDAIFKWLKAAGIKLQEIIDNELAEIAKLNPDVHYLFVKPTPENVNNDNILQNEMVQVVEYTSEIQKIHDESRGGVITANGKQWLVIGIQHFKEGTEQETLFRKLQTHLKYLRNDFFERNPSQRFWVKEPKEGESPRKYVTKIADIAPGRLVKRLLSDDSVPFRKISDLLKDSARNPKKLELMDLKWGIQVDREFHTVNVLPDRDKVYPPNDSPGNNGAVFVLVPAANGGYIPARIASTTVSNLNSGEIKTEILNLVYRLASSKHSERLAAVKTLVQRVVLTDDDNILIGTEDSPTVSIKKNGRIIKTINVANADGNTAEEIWKAFETMLDPRIQIGIGSLSDKVSLEALDEAGALTTDIALLGTVNANHYVYALSKGEIVEDAPEVNAPSTEWKRKYEHSVRYKGEVYRETDGVFYDKSGNEVTDNVKLSALQRNQKIMVEGLTPVKTEKGFEYYIIDSERGTVWKRKTSTNEVWALPEEAALPFIEDFREQVVEESRTRAIEEALSSENYTLENVSLEEPEVDLPLDGISHHDETSTSEAIQEEPETTEEVKSTIEEGMSSSARTFVEESTEVNSYSFSDIAISEEFGEDLYTILEEKGWEDMPDDMDLLEPYLNKKGITTVGITDIPSWLEIIRECK